MQEPSATQPDAPVAAQTGVRLDSLDRLEELSHVLRARKGVTESFTWLLTRHERALLYYLRRLVGNPESALDLHQEVWLAVFRGLQGLRNPKVFRAWLYSVAHNKAVRFIHKELREEQTYETLVEEDEPAQAEPDPSCVHHALSRIPAQFREVLTLHYLRELSLEEIAFACDLPLGTVKSRLHKARAAMRRELEKGCYD